MKILFAGGGTGGHINPALSIAKFIKDRRPDAKIDFVGTKEGMERDLVPKEGFPLHFIDVHGFKRSLSFYNVGAARRVVTSLFEARRLLLELSPDLVVGTGGYVSGPVVYMASKMGIKTVIHEQNVYPGVTNRLLARVCDRVLLAFLDSREYFPKRANTLLVGNPVRPEILMANYKKARAELKIDENTPFVVSFAGSLGAREMNKRVINMLPKIIAEKKFKFLHATGERGWLWAPDMARGLGVDLKDTSVAEIRPYIYNMPTVMAAADLIVSRAGAITLSEIAAAKKPSILIPSPNVTRNHQEVNARSFERANAAKVILEKDLTPGGLYDEIMGLIFNREKLEKMSENVLKLAIFDSCDKIYGEITQLLKT